MGPDGRRVNPGRPGACFYDPAYGVTGQPGVQHPPALHYPPEQRLVGNPRRLDPGRQRPRRDNPGLVVGGDALAAPFLIGLRARQADLYTARPVFHILKPQRRRLAAPQGAGEAEREDRPVPVTY